MSLPMYVATPIKAMKMHPDVKGCCVPLAVAMATRTHFADVVVMMHFMGFLMKNGGVYTADLEKFFNAFDVYPTLTNIWAATARSGVSTRQRPTINKFLININGLRRHIFLKNGHAIYADPLTKRAYDHRGQFPEMRSRMNFHFELTIEDCETFRKNLTRTAEESYTRRGTDRIADYLAIPFVGRKRGRRMRRTW